MSVQEVDIPEVQSMHQSARFFKDGERDFVEISFVGSKDTVVRKVAPEHMAKYRDAWMAYCDGSPPKMRPGTPLTDIRGMAALVAEKYVAANVHTMEELAALSDAQCQALGHGTLTFRNVAREALEQRRAQEMDTITRKISAAAKSVRPLEETDERYASKSDLEALSSKMDAILAALSAPAAQPAKRGPGRPPKTPKPDGE